MFCRVRLMGFLPGLTNHSALHVSPGGLPSSPSSYGPSTVTESQLGVRNPVNPHDCRCEGREHWALEASAPGGPPTLR